MSTFDDQGEGPPVIERLNSGSLVMLSKGRSRVNSERLAGTLRTRQNASSISALLSRFVASDSPSFTREAMSGDVSSDSDTGHESSDSASSTSSTWEMAKGCLGRLGCLKKYFTVLDWAGKLTRTSVQADVVAGLTVCVMVIPQSMSYAKIAGLPYVYGMYAACVPPLVYALFGQARQLAVGPVAMTSLILRAGLMGKLDEKSCPSWYDDSTHIKEVYQNEICTQEYCFMAFSVAAMVGIILLAAFFFRLGFLVSFLGHPVISGFSTGAAMIIGLSQLKYFLGYKLPSTEHAHELLYAVVKDIHLVKPAPLILGLTWLAFLIGLKHLARRNKRFKMLAPLGPLLCCVAGTLLVWLCPVLRKDYHVAHVGQVPGGLFPVSFRDLDVNWELFQKIRVTAVSAALIGFMESIAISKNLGSQHGYNVEASQELVALGLTNFVGSMFSCYAVTGSFSRSAVANTTGAQTQLAGVITGVCMLLVLLFLTPAFYYLPMFALAAVVINSVMSLIAYDVAIGLWKVKRWDFVLWLVAFIGTLFIGPLEGIGIAVAMSICVVIYESVRPQLTVLWRVPGTKIYRSIDQEARGEFIPHVLIVRLTASLYFANVSYVKEVLLKYIEDVSRADVVQYVILEMTSVHTIDSTAAHLIEDIVGDFRGRGIQTAFAMVGHRTMRTFERANLVSLIGDDMFYPSVDAAVKGCLSSEVSRSTRKKTIKFEALLEVGISNDMHSQCTQVHVFVPHTVTGLVNLISSVFVSHGCRVDGAQVDNVSHTYHIVKEERKLTDQEIVSLRARLHDVLAGIYSKSQAAGTSETSVQPNESITPMHSEGFLPMDTPVSPAGPGPGSTERPALEEALATERLRVAAGELAKERVKALEAQLGHFGLPVGTSV